MARVKGAVMTRKHRNKILGLDHPYQRRLQSQRYELLHIHARSQDCRYRDEPQDALRDGYTRARSFQGSLRNSKERLLREENSIIKQQDCLW